MKEQEFFEKMAEVWLELSNIREQADNLVAQMAELENAGMVNATIHTRSDNGGMELLHPTGSAYEKDNSRRREYIGKKPEAQEAARARVERWHKHVELKREWSRHQDKVRQIEYRIEYLYMAALGKQAKLFSDVGTQNAGQAAARVPTDWNWLTPQMVIDYFKQSPILAAVADDVQAVLGKVEWVEVQKAA